MSHIKSKVQTFEVPNTNLIYHIQVFEDGKLIAHTVKLNGEIDHANTYHNIRELHHKIRPSVKLYYDKCLTDFEADKSKSS